MADTVAMAAELVPLSLLAQLRKKNVLTPEDVREMANNAHYAVGELTNIDESSRETIRSLIDQVSGMP